jgi:hypothetical protein
MKRCLTIVCALILAIPAFAQPSAQLSLTALLARAGDYVARFESEFSSVVSEERYEQSAIPGGPSFVGSPRLRHTELVSDFLLVRLPDYPDWVPFRDVFEVDGEPVRDHDQRLVQMFVRPDRAAAERAAEITEESARFNIGISRTVNHPLLALNVLRPAQQSRFRFSGLKADVSAGADVSLVEYREDARPTIIRGPAGRDMPMHGRLWLHGPTGRLVRTEVAVNASGVAATLLTRFEYDAALAAAIPIDMREEYIQPNGTRITGLARYGRFRKFRVDVNFGR